MAEATEMTLTGARSARVGEERREVRLSVTYALDKAEERMDRACAVKMAEVERGITAAWDALERRGNPETLCDKCVETDRIAPEPALNSPDDEEYDSYFNGEEDSGEEPDEDEPISSPTSAEVSPAPQSIPVHKAPEAAGYRSPVSAAPAPPEPEVLASKVQLLAIRPLLTRLNFNSNDTRDLLQKFFKKWTLERLTRDEANDLLVSLRRGEIEVQQKRQGVPSPGMNGSCINGSRAH